MFLKTGGAEGTYLSDDCDFIYVVISFFNHTTFFTAECQHIIVTYSFIIIGLHVNEFLIIYLERLRQNVFLAENMFDNIEIKITNFYIVFFDKLR